MDFRLFAQWVADNLGPRPDGWTLDRIDSEGDYAPGNLRWATKNQQALNRSSTSKTPGVMRTKGKWWSVQVGGFKNFEHAKRAAEAAYAVRDEPA